ncbi:MAG: hypothetical protein Q8914_09885, partial [Bacteroidota bacterium]|nr:hypothetical protein [Bacteroidota bacterium]
MRNLNYIIGCFTLMLAAQGILLETHAEASLINKQRIKKALPKKTTETVSRYDTVFVTGGSVAPDVPDSVTFCGATIDLRRYDRRERYDREMLAMMYMHSSTLLMMKRANRYFPIIEPI